MIEIWADVPNYEQFFKVSTYGRVFSKRTRKILKLYTHKNGYHVFTTRIGGRRAKAVSLKVHRLVASAFMANPENKQDVNHKDCNKINNKLSNLEWATRKENVDHAFLNNLCKINRGVEHSMSKLSTEDIKVILKECRKFGGTKTLRALAKEYNVAHSRLSDITNGHGYKNEVQFVLEANKTLVYEACTVHNNGHY